MKRSSIALIGFMATGKTTVGKALVKNLGDEYQFIETDELVIRQAGKSIPEIFAENGEDAFRQFEAEICEKVSLLEKVVISCGGGIVLNPDNIRNLRRNCYIVLLKAPIQEIYNRVVKNGKESRPIINKKDPLREIKEVLEYREPLYESAAEFTINTSNKSINSIIKAIIQFYKTS